MSDPHPLQEILKSHDKFFTVQRRIIVEELFKMETHPTAEQVYFIVKERLPNISLGTVYRNLQTLEELGVIDKVVFRTQSEARYEIHKDPHYHIICQDCSVVKDLGSFRSVSLEPTAEKMTGFEVLTHEVVVYGLCPNCRGVVGNE